MDSAATIQKDSNTTEEKPKARVTEEFKRTVQLATDSFERVNKYLTPPLPTTYKLWYHYSAGRDKKFVARIDALLERDGTLTPYEINQINDEFFSVKNATEINELLGPEFEKSLHKLSQIVINSEGSADEYVASLEKANAGLSDLTTPEQLGSVIQALVSENQRMRSQTMELSDGLKESTQQIDELSSKLAEAHANSLKDPLTGVGNRRSFDASLAHEIEEAKSSDSALCLVLADIDHFKRVNDTFGHVIGDEILKIFATILDTSTKGRDTVARYGGEEFALILPQTELAHAHKLVERMRGEMEVTNLVIKNNEQSVGTITSSFGISQLTKDDTIEEFIKRVDSYLYDAKKTGRNRTVAK